MKHVQYVLRQGWELKLQSEIRINRVPQEARYMTGLCHIAGLGIAPKLLLLLHCKSSDFDAPQVTTVLK
jgi:hypothetical protein